MEIGENHLHGINQTLPTIKSVRSGINQNLRIPDFDVVSSQNKLNRLIERAESFDELYQVLLDNDLSNLTELDLSDKGLTDDEAVRVIKLLDLKEAPLESVDFGNIMFDNQSIHELVKYLSRFSALESIKIYLDNFSDDEQTTIKNQLMHVDELA